MQSIIADANTSSFGVLYDRYSNKVYRKCLSFTNDVATAKDLTHDVFIKVLMNLSKFKGNSKFSTWLYSVTYNYCVDYVNKNNKYGAKQLSEDTEISDSKDDLNEKLLMEIKVDRLQVVLDNMRPENKMILLMKYQDSASIQDIMQATNKKESAVKMAIKRAKEEAAKVYEQHFG